VFGFATVRSHQTPGVEAMFDKQYQALQNAASPKEDTDRAGFDATQRERSRFVRVW